MPPTSEPFSKLPFFRLRRIVNTILAALHNRVQLFGLEFREEKLRLAEALVLGAVAFFFAQLGLLLLTLALAFFFSDKAVWVIALCGLLYLLIALGCAATLRHQLRHRPPPFSGTVAELKKDREWLKPTS
jgi:uncharacterized membrane protein YqjE